jgi:hypothetical protein
VCAGFPGADFLRGGLWDLEGAVNHLHGLDEYEAECRKAQDDEQGGMAAIAYPLIAIASTVACWVIAGWLV